MSSLSVEVARIQNSESRIRSFRDLKVWQNAMNLVTQVYELSDKFPAKEQYTLTSQLRRAAISVPSNIAEGSSKRSLREYIRFLNIAHGSLAEIETQLEIAVRLNYISADVILKLVPQVSEIGRMLNGLINSLENKLSNN
jgi:four helix bundle protein